VTKVRRRDSFRIDAFEMVGERLRVEGHLSRTGIQVYDDGFGGKRREYRPPDEVFAAESLASLRGIPLTIDHPAHGMVTADNWRDLAVGNVGDDARKSDDTKHVKATLWAHDAAAIRMIQGGELQELSVGYWARLEETTGTTPEGEQYDAIQREIRGNHLALLKPGTARGGPTVRLLLDALGQAVMHETPASGTNQQFRRDGSMKIQIKADGYTFEVEAENDAVAQAVNRERQKLTERADAAEKARDAEKARADDAEKGRDAEKARADAASDKSKELQGKLDSATDPKAVAAMVDARARLVSDAKLVADRDDFKAEGTDAEIKRSALEARGVKLEGKSDAYVDARFDVEADSVRESKRIDSTDVARSLLYSRDRGGEGGNSRFDHSVANLDNPSPMGGE